MMPGHRRKALQILLGPTSTHPSESVPHTQNCKFSLLISHWLPWAFVCVLVHGTPWHHYVNPCRAAVDASLAAYERLHTRTHVAPIKKIQQHKARKQLTVSQPPSHILYHTPLIHKHTHSPCTAHSYCCCAFFQSSLNWNTFSWVTASILLPRLYTVEVFWSWKTG